MSVEITKNLVFHVAKLGMIKIHENEVVIYQEHLARVLAHVEELALLDTHGVAPFVSPMRERLDWFQDHCDRREDFVMPSLSVADVLKNAPAHGLNQFKVDAVIKEGE